MTLVELLVSIVLSALILASFVVFHRHVATTVRVGLDRVSQRQTLSAAREFLLNEMRSMAGGIPSVRLPDSRTLTYRAIRWSSMTCAWSEVDDSVRVLVHANTYGMRGPAGQRDSIELFDGGYPTDSTDDAWIRSAVMSVRAARCPDGVSAMQLTLSRNARIDAIVPGSPVVGWESSMLRFYRGGDGAAWLGVATGSTTGWNTIQPAFGPFDWERSRFDVGGDNMELTAMLVTPNGDSLPVKAHRRGVW